MPERSTCHVCLSHKKPSRLLKSNGCHGGKEAVKIHAMNWIVGIVGFICGFCAGQILLMFMLRYKTNQELQTDKSLKIYGLLNWLIAGLGAATFVYIYRKYFGGNIL